MGYTTVPEALRAAGRNASGSVDELRGADCGAPVSGVEAALPGSTAGGAATSFAHQWSDTHKTWCTDAGKHAQSLTDSANDYHGTEQRNTGGFQPTGSH